MAGAARLLNKLYNPFPQILSYLESLERQINLQTSSPDDGGDTGGGTTYGTLTASRRNSKPFIFGFIPPDNIVNFIPTEKVSAEVGTLPRYTSNSGPTDPSEYARTNVSVNAGNDGEIPRVRVTVDAAEARQKIYDAYISQTGKAPTENTLGLITSQVFVEMGKSPGTKSFQSTSFNLGNSHAQGQGDATTRGEYAEDQRSIAARKGGTIDPKIGITKQPPIPKGGTYYLGSDSEKDQVYPVYFTGFKTLDDAVNYQVNLLVRRWPAAANAQTVNDYINGLLPSDSGNYFDPTIKERYKRGVETQFNAYKKQFPKPLGVAVDANKPKVINADEEEKRKLMTYGSFNGVEDDDPLANRLGRNIKLADIERQLQADKQTQFLRQQIDVIAQTPPLILLINPKEFTRNYEPTVDDSVKGRYGHIVHMWMESPSTISSSGVTAGQYIVDAEGSGGLTNAFRIHSISYQNLLSLLLMYKNNGVIFANEDSDKGIPILAFTIFMYYDNHIYLGSFDSFGVSDSGDKPFNLEYNFKFTVRYDMELDAPFVDSTIADSLGF